MWTVNSESYKQIKVVALELAIALEIAITLETATET